MVRRRSYNRKEAGLLTNVMEFYGLTKVFRQVGYFKTVQQQHLLQELTVAIRLGQLIALVGIL